MDALQPHEHVAMGYDSSAVAAPSLSVGRPGACHLWPARISQQQMRALPPCVQTCRSPRRRGKKNSGKKPPLLTSRHDLWLEVPYIPFCCYELYIACLISCPLGFCLRRDLKATNFQQVLCRPRATKLGALQRALARTPQPLITHAWARPWPDRSPLWSATSRFSPRQLPWAQTDQVDWVKQAA